MNIKLYREWAAKLYTEDERQKIKRALEGLKDKLVENFALLYNETELSPDEREYYAKEEVWRVSCEALESKMRVSGVSEAEILNVLRNLQNG